MSPLGQSSDVEVDGGCEVTEQRSPAVVLLPWGQVIEDYLDTIGIDTNAFLGEMDGGWMFGYIDALATAGIATTIVWPSAV